MSGLTRDDIYSDLIKKDPPLPEHLELFYKFEHLGIPFVTAQGSRFLCARWGDGGSQTTPLHYSAVRLAAIRQFIEEHGTPPSESAIRSAFRAFCAKANNSWRDIHLRIGLHDHCIHIDPAWRAPSFAGKHIVISAQGWSTRINQIDTILPPAAASHPPLDPKKHTSLEPLAALEPLRHLLRLDNDRPAWLRVLVWLLAAFRPPASPDAPRDLPILQISGPPSSGKTSAARILRALVDPSNAPITLTPTTEAATGRLARDNHVIFVDGITRLNRRPAELLSRLSTGLPAKFHGDMQNLSRPILLTTNEEGAADRLAHRVLPVDLPPLPNPIPQDELRARFEELRPSLLAALLTLLSTALRRIPDTPCPANARFPEAVQWAAAALESLDLNAQWDDTTYPSNQPCAMGRYRSNSLICVTRPHDPLEAKLSSVITDHGGTWKGRATDLARAIGSHLSPRALSQKLKQISLICVTTRRTGRKRTLTLTQQPPHENRSLSELIRVPLPSSAALSPICVTTHHSPTPQPAKHTLSEFIRVHLRSFAALVRALICVTTHRLPTPLPAKRSLSELIRVPLRSFAALVLTLICVTTRHSPRPQPANITSQNSSRSFAANLPCP